MRVIIRVKVIHFLSSEIRVIRGKPFACVSPGLQEYVLKSVLYL